MTTEQTTEAAAPQVDEAAANQLAIRTALRTLAECCRVVEDGVSNVRETDLGMALGAGIAPGPFARTDDTGLDVALQAMEWAEGEWGEAFAVPVLLRRLVAQGRLGKKSCQGFYAYPQPDAGDQTEHVLLETRGNIAIAWLDHAPMNALSPDVLRDFKTVWEKVEGNDEIRALVVASASQAVFSAGADLKAFAKQDAPDMEEYVRGVHQLMRSMEQGRVVTIAAVNGAALGGGCELALACDQRIVAESAVFGLPEISLGLVPGFGGTQRLKRVAGTGRALAMMATGDAISAWQARDIGLADEVVTDHELFDAAVGYAEKLAAQAPLSLAHVKRLADDPTLDADLVKEQEAFFAVFRSADAIEGIGAFLQKRKPNFTGK